MALADIVIRGAREHNLRNVDLTLPRNQLIVMTGVSGSGKSSLAFDTLYAEGQRRYVESLSSYARQFLGQMPKPEVDSITGLAPSISIQQKTSGRNPRSTVGTITEIYDYLRVLFARVGQGNCERCGKPITAQSLEQILEHVLQLPDKTRFLILSPLIQNQKGEYKDLFEDLLKQGYLRARVDGEVVQLTQDLQLDRQMKHNIEVVVDRLVAGKVPRARLAEALELALKLSGGTIIISQEVEGEAEKQDKLYSSHYACVECGISYEPPSPQLFSFNSPRGMCLDCNGLGERHDFVLDRLIPDPSLSLMKGAIEPLGPWKNIGKWKKHIYKGVAEAIEKQCKLKKDEALKTKWSDLPEEARNLWLHGLGDRHITFSWRHSGGIWKHGGTFAGLIEELLEQYRKSNNPMKRTQLEGYMQFVLCPTCHGARLNPQARHVTLTSTSLSTGERPASAGREHTSNGKGERPASAGREQISLSLPGVCGLSIQESAQFFESLELSDTQRIIAEEALKEIRGRLGFLLKCGLNYLTLDRTAPTLSGGETQRIRLASQIGCGLVGVVYILDEPSIGLHPRDNEMLLESLCDLRDQGNTVIVVEHDEETMRAADYIVDFGPGPGVRGGEIVARGQYNDIIKAESSVTGQYLSGKRVIEIPKQRRPVGEKKIKIVGAKHNNLRNVDVEFPLETFICVTGVSGSGKSSLVNDILWEVLNRDLNKGNGDPGLHDRIEGLELLDKAIDIDQSPIGRTPRSNPATYVKLFDQIRSLYTQLADAKIRGYKPGRFSFNVPGGRCEACEGHGSNKLEMDFLADIWVTCPVCQGHRFNHETLEIRYNGKNIAEVLEMDIQEGLVHFEHHPKIYQLLKTLHDVGLDYLKLGQPSPTLSGGEAQRIKLARELGKRSTGKTIYLLDEPTTGLHFADIHMLLKVLHDFVDQGNTVLVVEHNIDVLKTADWIIDIGPEGGKGGGTVIAQGTPEQIAACEHSHTGKALHAALYPKKKKTTARRSNGKARSNGRGETEIVIRGAAQHNLQHLDLNLPREKMNVFCGPSGSGKSSLAMQTIYAEGQRRYVESLSAYARQFLGQMPKPRVDHIHGLSPAIAIEQKNTGTTPRSTVGTVTEVYDYLRVLYARLGQPYCPDCNIPIETQTTDEVVEKILSLPEGTKALLLAPQEVQVGQSYDALWERLKANGYARVRINGETHRLEEVPKIDRKRKHQVEIVVDRISIAGSQRSRIADSVESGLELGKGNLLLAVVNEDLPEVKWETHRYSLLYACTHCGRSFEELVPHHFSFNSPLGWCPACEGLGVEQGHGGGAEDRVIDESKSLLDGAITLWPAPKDNAPLREMLETVCKHFKIPMNVPFGQLYAGHQRMILQGTGGEWFSLRDKKKSVVAQFQYKGVYPAIEEARRVSYHHRQMFRDQTGEVACSACHGSRLRDDAAAVKLKGKTIQEVGDLSLNETLSFLQTIKLTARDKKIAGDLLTEATSRLSFLVDVGLHYLTMARPLPTLSGGETQRIRLAGQIGRALTGVLYVLDEPTIGLHAKDNSKLIEALHKLRDLGNTLVLVEHDREVMEAADRLYDFGPGAGRFGGTIVGEGTPKQLAKRASLTGKYLSDREKIPLPLTRRMQPGQTPPGGGWLELIGAGHHNLRNVDLKIPLGTLTCITGVSGSGKSSLIEETLARAVARKLSKTGPEPGAHEDLLGVELINKLIAVDQQPLGSTPASNPATYTGVFEQIRELFASIPEAKVRGYRSGRFSFNRSGGRCESCEGNGQKCIEMHFLPDVWVTCEECNGKRYNQETLAVKYRGRSIADVLEMSISEALELFENIPKIRSYLATLEAIGLGYLTLGQSAPTLSGGEAQRVKLAAELARPNTGRTLYLLDEPTTGLHFDDIAKLLKVVNSLVEAGNTVVIIEHNLDVIKTADWVVDIGPEAGKDGGLIVAEGTPEEIVKQKASGGRKPSEKANDKRANGKKQGPDVPRSPQTRGAYAPRSPQELRSYTAELLGPLLKDEDRRERDIFDVASVSEQGAQDLSIKDVGLDTKMPWQTNGRRWHTVDRLSHAGKPVRWEGSALALVVDAIGQSDFFKEPNWNNRSIVEITTKEKNSNWFLHAMTGEEWFLKLKFRTKAGTFELEKLQKALALKSADDLEELPVYGQRDRVRVLNSGAWQEVIITVHWLKEIETSAFRDFLQKAMQGYQSQIEAEAGSPAEVDPWVRDGREWHTSRRGFPAARGISWTIKTLEALFDDLIDAAPEAEIDWQNKQIVNFRPADEEQVWATVHTKRRSAIDLMLYNEPGRTTFGSIAAFGDEREVIAWRDGREAVKIRLTNISQVEDKQFREFLRQHWRGQQ